MNPILKNGLITLPGGDKDEMCNLP
jgi:hypothetical protein